MTANNFAKRKTIFRLPALIVILLLVLGMTYFLFFTGATDDKNLSEFSDPDSLIIPPRPGVQGIIITGPEIKDLVFAIDTRTAGIQPIIWQTLQAKGQTAEVTIRAKVLPNGNLNFSRENGDIRDRGNPDAGKYLQEKMATWAYFPHKTGVILFYFNVGSKGKKLIIDIDGVKKSPGISERVRVKNGALSYIEGLAWSQIAEGNVKW